MPETTPGRNTRRIPPFSLGSRAGIDAAVDEELEFHLEMVTAALIKAGWNEADARSEARRRFGNFEYTRRYCRAEDSRRVREKQRMKRLDELGQDMKYALRTLRKSPGFTLAVLLTLALGIGANTAIFSVVRTVLLEPLPFPQAERVVRIWHANQKLEVTQGAVSEPDFLDWKAQSKLVESMGGYFFREGFSGMDLTGDGPPTRISIALVTDGFFETLRAGPLHGRVLAPEDQLEGRNTVVVLGHGLWSNRYNADPTIVGKTIQLDGKAFTVVGVMPANFSYPADHSLDAWIPLSYFGPDQIGRARGAQFLEVIARMKSGVTLAQLHEELRGIATAISQTTPDNPGWNDVTLLSIRESITGNVQRPLALVFGAVFLVLVITCANVASLLLARASTRQRELAVRSALGAGRSRIIRQLLTESLVLAIGGGLLGIAVAMIALRLLMAGGTADLPRLTSASIDGYVLAFTLGLSLFAGVLFGILPTLRAAGPSLEDAVRGGGRGTVGTSGNRLRSVLVVAQIALAVMLVSGAGLTIKSFQRLLSVDLGFNPAHALAVNMSIPDRYTTTEARLNYYEGVLEAIRQVPGVVSVGSIRDLPTRGNGEGRRPDSPESAIQPGQGPQAQMHQISSDYFKAMEIPLKEGRIFTRNDNATTPFVVIVNEELARRFWPGQSALGKRLRMGQATATVVGVVGNVRQRGPAEAVDPVMYVHQHQQGRGRMSIVVRTKGDPVALTSAVRQAIWSVNPDQTITSISSLESVMGSAVSRPRLLASLFALFGLLGLTLGALGIYGVLAFTVAQRRQEIGVRVALGAPPMNVLRLVVSQGMVLAVTGIVLGMLGAFGVSGSLQALLFDIPATDLVTLTQVGLILLATALLASVIPARRALGIDPAIALRYD